MTEHILSLSYGKDSLACLGAIEELGWPLDRIVHAEVWATDTIPADLPPMVEFKEKADKIIKERWGIEVEHVRSRYSYQDGFYIWIVRRLTPTECERLQGFPAGWTDIGEWVDSKGKRHKPSDGPRYKALGNSIALPQWWWLTCKMAAYLPEHATLGSLFDGIGGFPLVWETRHGKGTAV